MCCRSPMYACTYPKPDGWEKGGRRQGASCIVEKHTMKSSHHYGTLPLLSVMLRPPCQDGHMMGEEEEGVEWASRYFFDDTAFASLGVSWLCCPQIFTVGELIFYRFDRLVTIYCILDVRGGSVAIMLLVLPTYVADI